VSVTAIPAAVPAKTIARISRDEWLMRQHGLEVPLRLLLREL